MYYILIPVFAFIAILVILACINISVNIVYRSASESSEKLNDGKDKTASDLRVFARYAFFTFYILPEKAQRRDKKKKPKIGKEVTKAEKSIEKIKEDLFKEYKFSEIVELIKQIAGTLIENFQRHLKLTIKRFVLIVATDDAQKTALTYGAATQTAYYLYEFLSHYFKVSHDDIKVYSDFTKEKMSYDIDMKFSIKLGHAVKMVLLSVINYKNIDKNKDNAKQEQDTEQDLK